jgi:hypothetical protein
MDQAAQMHDATAMNPIVFAGLTTGLESKTVPVSYLIE